MIDIRQLLSRLPTATAKPPTSHSQQQTLTHSHTEQAEDIPILSSIDNGNFIHTHTYTHTHTPTHTHTHTAKHKYRDIVKFIKECLQTYTPYQLLTNKKFIAMVQYDKLNRNITNIK